MQSDILWYDIFKGCLDNIGFKVNRYNTCVDNKIIDGKQCTICWYVNDTKILHEDPKVLSGVIAYIEGQFEKMV